MRYLKLNTTLFFLCILFFAQAQEAKQLSIVHLKDGSFLKGEVIYQEADGNLTLRMFTGAIIELNMDLIDSIEKQKAHQRLLSSGHSIKTKGAYFSFQFNSLLSEKATYEWNVPEKRFGGGGSISYGYLFNQYLGLGLGVGFDGYGDYFLPAFLEIKGSFLKKRISPTYNIGVGYGFAVGGEGEVDPGFKVVTREGGLMFHPAIGFRLASRKAHTFFFDLGYKFQHTVKSREYDPEWFWDGNTYIDDIWYKSFAVRFGWEF